MRKKYLQRKSDKEIEEGDLLYSINEDDKTSKIIAFISPNKEIIIPLSVNRNANDYIITSISKGAFQFSEIKSVSFSTDSGLLMIDNLAFSESTIECFTIPPHLTKIKECAFNQCYRLHKFEIPSNSKLQTIEKFAFSFTSIEFFQIPPHLTKISECTFCNCQQLRTIEIPSNSELQSIESGAFDGSLIEEIEIPKNLVDLQKGWCINTTKLAKINVCKDNPRYSKYGDQMIIGKSSIDSSNVYDVLVFCSRNVKTIEIPNFIKIIGPFSFDRCPQLRTIEITKNSELQIIDEGAFVGSSIEKISIPSHVIQIRKEAFSYCQQLRKFEIQTDSKLQLIDKNAFLGSSIESFFIPQHVSQINEFAFSSCKYLRIIEVSENSKLNHFNQNLFDNCQQIILMVPSNFDVNFDRNDMNVINKNRNENDHEKIYSNIQFCLSSKRPTSNKNHIKKEKNNVCILY